MTVVHEDAWLLVVDKPCGLPTQAPRGGGDNLYDQLRRARPYVALHHRLDTWASGLVLFALDPSVNGSISAGLRDHLLRRRYRAILSGEAEPGVWDRPIDGRPARTDVAVAGHRRGRSAVALELHTGRTHQVRIHAALAGTPVLGDRRYGDETARQFPRLALHAVELELDHPATGARLVLTAPLPEPLATAWDEITR